jgi:hypothetical protein
LLRLVPEGVMRVQNDTTIRFRATLPEQGLRRVEVSAGQAVIETASVELQVETAGGTTRIAPNSGVRVSSEGESTQFVVQTGRAIIETGGTEHEVTAGEGLALDLGQATVERFSADTAPEANQTDAGGAAGDAGASAGLTLQVEGGAVEVRQGNSWAPLAPGSTNQPPGTDLRIGNASRVVLQRGSERVEVVGPGRITVAQPDQALLTARQGQVVGRAGDTPTVVAIPGGMVQIHEQSQARLGIGNDGETTVSADEGRLTIRTTAGTVELAAGETTTVGRGGQATPARGGGLPDLTVGGGESLVIHDPRPPTRLAIRLGCPEGGEVQVRRGRKGPTVTTARDEKRAVVELRTGAYHYGVHCLADGQVDSEAKSRGRVRILRDSGTKQLPARPRVTVDADGRRYSVHYQNRLPLVTFRWPEAPLAKRYHLVLEGQGGTRKIRLSRPLHRQRLGPGTATFHFELGGRRSRTSTVNLTQSRQSQPAYVVRPVEGRAAIGQTVEVRGGTYAESQIFVVGHGPLKLNDRGRFSAQVTVPGGHQSLAVRVQNPLTGVHYFLRHLRGTGR